MKINFFKKVNLLIMNLPSKIKVPIYRFFGMIIGNGTFISANSLIDNPKLCSIGTNCFLNSGVGLYTGAGSATITIKDNVWVGMGTKFICPTHKIGPSTQRAGQQIYQPILVENGCWIGANVTVLPGVKIGKGCIIAAGAVVTCDCLENCLYAGVPAKIKKQLDP